MRYIFYILSIAILFSASIAEAASISVGTITPNADVPVYTQIQFKLEPTGFTGTVQYTISDSFPGSTLSNSHVSRFGDFSWSPQMVDIGSHTITITAFDTVGNRATVNQTLVVREASAVAIKSLYPGSNIFPGKNVSFSVSALGYVSPQFSVLDSYWPSSISARNMSVDGNFGWTPTEQDVGVHNLGVRVSGQGGRSDTVYQTITVQGIKVENVYGSTAKVGQRLVFPIKAFGMSMLTYRVSDSMRGNTIDYATFSGNELIWTPTAQDIGTHRITVTATDNANQVATYTFTITITQQDTQVVSPVVVQKPTPSNPSRFVFTKNLSVGSRGTEVVELQKKLKAEGYFNGPTNGNFGQQTKAAVQKYQKAKEIQQLGNVGPGTRAALNK
jgi:hypothetical protein